MSKIRLQNIFDISNLARNLAVLLRDLTFSDNFRSFSTTITIPDQTEASGDYKIRNQLSVRPNSYIIRMQTGNALVTAGDTLWDDNFIYMKNHSTTIDAVVTITFWRE